jgi:hypothetical protein
MTVTAGADFQIRMSVDSVVNGTKLARNEIAKLAAIQRASKTDADRLTEGLDLVERALKAEQITADAAAKAIAHLQDKYGTAAIAARELAEAEQMVNRQRKADLDVINTKLKIQQQAYDQVTKAQQRSNDETRKANMAFANSKLSVMQADFNKTTGSLNDFGRGMESAFIKQQEFSAGNWKVAGSTKAATGSMGAMSAGAGALGLVLTGAAVAIDQYLRGVDRIAKEIDAAAAIGQTREEMRILTQAISEVAGVDVSQAVGGIKQLQTQIGMAAVGQGKSQKVLEMLGLDAKSLASMDATEQFKTVAEAISRVEDRSVRAAMAQKLFGDSQMANAAISGNVAQAMKEIEASTWSMTEGQERATAVMDDTITRLFNTIGSARDRMVGEVSEALVIIGGGAESLRETSVAASDLARSSAQLEEQLKATEEAAKAEADAIKKAQEDAERAALEYYNTIESIQGKIRALTKGDDAQRAYELRQRGLSMEQTNEIMASEKKLAALEAEKKAQEEADKLQKDQAKQATEAAAKIRKELETPAETIARTITELQGLVAANALSIADAEREILRVTEEQSKKAASERGTSQVATLKLADAGAFKQLAEIQGKQKDTEKRQLWIAEQSNKQLQEIAKNTAAFKPVRAAR